MSNSNWHTDDGSTFHSSTLALSSQVFASPGQCWKDITNITHYLKWVCLCEKYWEDTNQEVASIHKGPSCFGFLVEVCFFFLIQKKSEALHKHFTTCTSTIFEPSKLRLEFSSTLLIMHMTYPGPAVTLCLHLRSGQRRVLHWLLPHMWSDYRTPLPWCSSLHRTSCPPPKISSMSSFIILWRPTSTYREKAFCSCRMTWRPKRICLWSGLALLEDDV